MAAPLALLLLVALGLLALLEAAVITDVGITLCPKGGCAFDPWTGKRQPLTVAYRYSDTQAQWNIESPLWEAFSKQWNTTVILRRGDPNFQRDRWIPVMESTLGQDIVGWTSVAPFGDLAVDLTPIAHELGWNQSYSPQVMAQATVNGKIIGLPDRYGFYAMWYRRSFFAANNLVVPTTWAEFMTLCRAIRALGVTPIGIGLADKWQPEVWWGYMVLRMGGADWWRRMIAGGIDLSTDPVSVGAWEMLQQMIDEKMFPSPINSTIPLTFTNVAGQFSTGQVAMFLFTGLATTLPVADADFFQVPIMNSTVPHTEMSTGIFWMVNKKAKAYDVSLEWIRYASTLNYSLTLVPALGGSSPGHSGARPYVVSEVARRGFALIDNADRLVSTLDVDATGFSSGGARTLMNLFFSNNGDDENGMTAATILPQLDRVRQEVLLQKVISPSFSKPSGTTIGVPSIILELSSSTVNATIYYAVIDTTAPLETQAVSYFQYYGAVVLTGGTFRVLAYARKESFKDSNIVQGTYTITPDFAAKPYSQPIGTVAGIYAVSLVGIVVALVMGALIYSLRDKQLVKASSPLFLGLILVGCIMGYISTVLIVTYPVSSAMCVAIPWIGHLGFAMAFAPLFAKTHRLVRIFDMTALEVMKISNKQLLLQVAITCSVLGIYLVLWSAIDPPLPKTVIAEGVSFSVCNSNDDPWAWVIIIMEAAYLLWGCQLAFKSRNNPQLFNESPWIAVSIYNATVVGALVMMLYRTQLVTRPDAVALLQVIGFLIVTTATMLLIFMPKFSLMVTNGDIRISGRLSSHRTSRPTAPGGKGSQEDNRSALALASSGGGNNSGKKASMAAHYAQQSSVQLHPSPSMAVLAQGPMGPGGVPLSSQHFQPGQRIAHTYAPILNTPSSRNSPPAQRYELDQRTGSPGTMRRESPRAHTHSVSGGLGVTTHTGNSPGSTPLTSPMAADSASPRPPVIGSLMALSSGASSSTVVEGVALMRNPSARASQGASGNAHTPGGSLRSVGLGGRTSDAQPINYVQDM